MTSDAEVVKWQTRTFEGRVAQAVRVQVPPSAPTLIPLAGQSPHKQASLAGEILYSNTSSSLRDPDRVRTRNPGKDP